MEGAVSRSSGVNFMNGNVFDSILIFPIANMPFFCDFCNKFNIRNINGNYSIKTELACSVRCIHIICEAMQEKALNFRCINIESNMPSCATKKNTQNYQFRRIKTLINFISQIKCDLNAIVKTNICTK